MAETTNTPKERNFEVDLAKLTEVLSEKLQANILDELQVKQILTNFRETKNYQDVKQYLE